MTAALCFRFWCFCSIFAQSEKNCVLNLCRAKDSQTQHDDPEHWPIGVDLLIENGRFFIGGQQKSPQESVHSLSSRTDGATEVRQVQQGLIQHLLIVHRAMR